VINTRTASRWSGIHIIGIAGFVIGGVMGLIFLINGLIKYFHWKYKD
jgi:tetrahydromethanopterin S-methyltransferase subunit F